MRRKKQHKKNWTRLRNRCSYICRKKKTPFDDFFLYVVQIFFMVDIALSQVYDLDIVVEVFSHILTRFCSHRGCGSGFAVGSGKIVMAEPA